MVSRQCAYVVVAMNRLQIPRGSAFLGAKIKKHMFLFRKSRSQEEILSNQRLELNLKIAQAAGKASQALGPCQAADFFAVKIHPALGNPTTPGTVRHTPTQNTDGPLS